MILFFSGHSGSTLLTIVGSIVTRTPVIAIILAATALLVRGMTSVARKVDPIAWHATGIALGYFFIFVALDALTPDSFQDFFVRTHEDRRFWMIIMGPYVAAFVVSLGVYLVRRGRARADATTR